jgi:sterol desaturase/sphingolipid hydroxylase (fatty acid hydroxylase superfamily)
MIDVSTTGLIDALVPVEGVWLKFALVLGLLYLIHIVLYLGMGYALTELNKRHPERKVQSRETRVPVSREIRQGFISLLGSSVCLTLALLVQYQGWSMTPMDIQLPTITGIVWLVAFFVLSVILADIWFYAEHRLVHWKPLFFIHREHHLSPVPTPWTNERFTFTEVMMIQSYLFVVPFVLPIPAVVLVAHRFYDQVKGMFGHGGYEYFEGAWARWPSPFTCVTHHDAHHEKFSVNYGSFLTIWDRMFGTLEPGYDQKVDRVTKHYRSLNLSASPGKSMESK